MGVMRVNRLYRSKQDRIIAGVAGGLAEYFNVDAVLLRLLLVISVFFGGAGLFAYVIAWIIIPSEQGAYGEQPDARQQRGVMRPQAGRNAAAAETEGEGEAAADGEYANGPAAPAENIDGDAEQPAEAGKPCCAGGWGTGDVPGRRRRRNAGMLLIGLGIIFLADQLFGPIFHLLWPLLLILLGICLMFCKRREVRS